MLENSLDQESSLVSSFFHPLRYIRYSFSPEVYEGTYRKSRVAVKVLKDAASASLFLHEADIMR